MKKRRKKKEKDEKIKEKEKEKEKAREKGKKEKRITKGGALRKREGNRCPLFYYLRRDADRERAL